MPTFAELNLLDCANCRFEAGANLPRVEQPADCPHCGKKVAAYLFPVLLRPAPAAPVPGATIIGAESSCFYHATKRAAVACDVCGRFLCDLCDVHVEGGHRCALCIESKSPKTLRPGQRYHYYDSIALGVALAGVLFSFFVPVLAPLTLYIVVRYWKSPRSVLPRSRWRFVVAAGLALAELLAFVFFIVATVG